LLLPHAVSMLDSTSDSEARVIQPFFLITRTPPINNRQSLYIARTAWMIVKNWHPQF
jgi:hypothetical protein